MIFSSTANCTFCGVDIFLSNRAKFTITDADVLGVRLAIVGNVTPNSAILTLDGGVQMVERLELAAWTDGAIEVCFSIFVFEIATKWTIVTLAL